MRHIITFIKQDSHNYHPAHSILFYYKLIAILPQRFVADRQAFKAAVFDLAHHLAVADKATGQ